MLQHRTLSAPLLPGLKALLCPELTASFAPFICLFLSKTTTTIEIGFMSDYRPPTLTIPSMIATFPIICPYLRQITLRCLPEDSIVADAVSEMLLACNRNTLQKFNVDCLLTDPAREDLCQFPNISELQSAVEGTSSLPPMILPSLTKMHIRYLHGHEWLQGFHGAALDKLEFLSFHTTSRQVGDFLEAVEGVAMATSLLTTLTTFKFYCSRPWSPNYSPLHTFKQLTNLAIETPCHNDCSSAIDDETITNLARALPKLNTLRLGSGPCGAVDWVTIEGLVGLACDCADLHTLRVHIQVNSLV